VALGALAQRVPDAKERRRNAVFAPLRTALRTSRGTRQCAASTQYRDRPRRHGPTSLWSFSQRQRREHFAARGPYSWCDAPRPNHQERKEYPS